MTRRIGYARLTCNRFWLLVLYNIIQQARQRIQRAGQCLGNAMPLLQVTRRPMTLRSEKQPTPRLADSCTLASNSGPKLSPMPRSRVSVRGLVRASDQRNLGRSRDGDLHRARYGSSRRAARCSGSAVQASARGRHWELRIAQTGRRARRGACGNAHEEKQEGESKESFQAAHCTPTAENPGE